MTSEESFNRKNPIGTWWETSRSGTIVAVRSLGRARLIGSPARLWLKVEKLGHVPVDTLKRSERREEVG